jgi:Tfp pilus assembly protein PilV
MNSDLSRSSHSLLTPVVHGNDAGFSLTDVLASLLILSIAALALTKNTVTSLSTAKRALRTSVAAHLAQDRLEELLAINPQTLTEADSEVATPVIEQGITFVRTTNLPVGSDGARAVTVTVEPVPSDRGAAATLRTVIPLWGGN